jgi:hypothetical protein
VVESLFRASNRQRTNGAGTAPEPVDSLIQPPDCAIMWTQLIQKPGNLWGYGGDIHMFLEGRYLAASY